MCADLGCQLIARQKAVAVAARVEPGSFVVAADTVVVGPRGPLGKPGTPEVALRMLAELRGRRHTVLTGICVLRTGTESEALAVSRSLVKMRDFSDQELITYVASGEPLDKAGAYAVQGGGGDLVEAVSGRVDTVVGLDVALTLRLLAEAGFPDPAPSSHRRPADAAPARAPSAGADARRPEGVSRSPMGPSRVPRVALARRRPGRPCSVGWSAAGCGGGVASLSVDRWALLLGGPPSVAPGQLGRSS